MSNDNPPPAGGGVFGRRCPLCGGPFRYNWRSDPTQVLCSDCGLDSRAARAAAEDVKALLRDKYKVNLLEEQP